MRKKVNKVVQFERDSEFFFKVGIKYAEKNNYAKAFIYMNKAVEMEPFNADYQINLAGIMVEIGEIERSNEVLKGILINIDPTFTECYFGIGCNYFDLEDFSKAREYFEKYLHYDPEGTYADDVHDILYYLEFYDDTKSKRRYRSISKMVSDGKKLLLSGEFKKAAKKLEAALEESPSSTDIRINLSAAYFSIGDLNRAISMANSVLKLDMFSIEAHCNLAVFYNSAGMPEEYRRHVDILYKLRIEQKDDLLKVLNTCMKLKEYNGMGKLLRNYIGNKKEFLEALDNILDGWNIFGDKRQEIVNGLSRKRHGARK